MLYPSPDPSRAAVPVRRVSLCLAACVAFVAHSVSADSVRLKDGSFIKGEVVEFAEDELTFDPDLTDEIKIDLEDIEWIRTDAAVTVEVDGAGEHIGYLEPGADGVMRLRAEKPRTPVAESVGPRPSPTAPSAAADRKRPASILLEEHGKIIDLTKVRSIEPAKPFFNFEGHIDIGLNSATGNTDATNANLSGSLQPSFGKNHFTFEGQWNRGESEGATTASNWRITNIYERELSQRWLFNILNRFEHDALQNLNLRSLIGAGLGFEVFEPRPTLLKLALIPGYVHEDYERFTGGTTNEDDEYAALVWGLNFGQDLWTEDVHLYHNHSLIIGLSQNRQVALTTTGLEFDLIADLDLKLEIQFDWNSDPAAGAGDTDQRYLVKLSYDFEGDQEDWWQ